jgi:phosphoribosyl 1,2-cyclic phosphodiesterase
MHEAIFLGTGGARVVVFRQIRASGGLWLRLGDVQILVDPGPGSLVKAVGRRKDPLDPRKLNAIVLSHRHLDHSADVNVMVEAMTQGGIHPRGVLYAPQEALEDDPVVLRYVRGYLERIEVLHEGGDYRVGEVRFETPVRHPHHGSETYGMNLYTESLSISYIPDTRYFPELSEHYHGDVAIVSVVRVKPSQYDHLCVDDVREYISLAKPRATILTHFGMTMLRAKPWEVAAKLEEETGCRVIAARDGLKVDLEEVIKEASNER